MTTNELHDRINRVINTPAFDACLAKNSIELIAFQCNWFKISGGEFKKLPKEYQEAILAGEAGLQQVGELILG